MNVRGGGGGNVKIISTIKPVSSQLELIRDCRYSQDFCPPRSAGQLSGRPWSCPLLIEVKMLVINTAASINNNNQNNH